MKLFRQINFPIIEISIALLIILLPLSNNTDLMNGIQTAKSFNFFYSILFLVGIDSIAWLFKKGKPIFFITLINILLFAYVGWVTFNKYLVQQVNFLSLKQHSLMVYYVIIMRIALVHKKYFVPIVHSV